MDVGDTWMITEVTPTGVLTPKTAIKTPVRVVSVIHAGRVLRRTLANVTENADEEPEIGGDPACWAHLVCPECGRFAEGDSADRGICAVCGTTLPTDDD